MKKMRKINVINLIKNRLEIAFEVNQKQKKMPIKESKMTKKERRPSCCAKTQHNHNDVNNIANPKNSLRVSIHTPGFGKYPIHLGKTDKRKKGKAVPKPKPENNKKEIYQGCVTATPNAAPINGAVHGVATIVVNIPDEKELK